MNSNKIAVKKSIKKALKKFSCTSAILSFIYMSKENCITKEKKYKTKYEKKYKTNEESEKRMDLSVGEDLESFVEKIKNGKINKDTIPKDGYRSTTFLLCLLDKEERKKLDQKDETFLETFLWHGRGEVDVPEAEWEASESNLKFANNDCYRTTYFIDA